MGQVDAFYQIKFRKHAHLQGAKTAIYHHFCLPDRFRGLFTNKNKSIIIENKVEEALHKLCAVREQQKSTLHVKCDVKAAACLKFA
jgi:hypothetical protein